MSSLDFESEPAYWYIKTVRDSEKANLPVRSRPAVSRGEALQAREVRRRVDRLTFGHRASNSSAAREAFVELVSAAHICARCNQAFTRAEMRSPTARCLWRAIYPPRGGRIEVWRHTICPVQRGE